MTDEDKESKIPLKREQILKTEKRAKVFQLPSGITVQVSFLSLGMVHEIEKSVESAVDEGKERVFTEKVISWMLRGSDQKDLWTFSEKDQHRLIEIAVGEWECEEEYETLGRIDSPEVQFYQAVQLKNQQLMTQFAQLARTISISIPPIPTLFSVPWQENYLSACNMLIRSIQIDLAAPLQEFSRQIDQNMMNQFREIGIISISISKMVSSLEVVRDQIMTRYEANLLSSFGEALTSYQGLMAEVSPLTTFSALPEVVRYFPAVEMRNTSLAINRVFNLEPVQPSDEVSIEISHEGELILWLGDLDAAFPDMLIGAEQSAYSENVDRCRHFAASHRELLTHLLHLLSPDDQVKNWTSDSNYYENGKPTRRTRLLFIARNYQSANFVEFFVENFLTQMKMLNADEHRKAHDYLQGDLLFLHSQFLATLKFLMRIAKNNGA